VTGIVLYFTPKGSIANWTGWTLGGLDKEAWGDVHIVTGVMFILAGLVHLYFNWKPLKNYIYSKASKGLNRRSEMVAALALTGFIVVGSIEGWPPVSYVLEFNEWAKTDLWASQGAGGGGQGRSGSLMPPQTDLEKEQHDQALSRATEGIDAALAEAVAKVGGTSKDSQQSGAVSSESEEHVSGSGRGGFGRMTVRDVASRYGLSYDQIKTRLETAGIAFQDGEALRDIANRNGMTPGDVGSIASGQ
jgi:hypothetical protein